MILVFLMVGILLTLVGVGVWYTFGPGAKDVRDPIAEHARMHELGLSLIHI